MNNCIGDVLKSIIEDCNNPSVGGYTGRAVLLPWGMFSYTQNADNPRMFTALTPSDSDVAIAVENAYITPFDGSATSSENNNGKLLFAKLLAFRVPMRGAEVSKKVIEPIVKSAKGFLAVVEKKQNTADGKYEVIGFGAPLRVSEDGVSRNEGENGGDATITLSCSEAWFEAAFVALDSQQKPDLAATIAAFETLWQSCIDN